MLACLALCVLFSSGVGYAAPFDIPLRTWIAVPAPEDNPAGPDTTFPDGYRGPAGACPNGQCKHMRVVHNPDNGRIYFNGGDYDPGSGTNQMWSYSIANDDWILETPYCSGSTQPAHPDETGFTYDTSRQQFWLHPGYQGGFVGCDDSSHEVEGEAMTFDPDTRTWQVVETDPPWSTYAEMGVPQFSQYDPVTDRILAFEYGIDTILSHDPSTGIVTKVHTDLNANVTDSNVYVAKEYTAFDPVGRTLYVVDPDGARLYAYDIDTNEARFLTDTPTGSAVDLTMIFWDSVNEVLLYTYRDSVPVDEPDGQLELHVYHPDTNSWEWSLPIDQPEGIEVKGNSGVYDPIENVLLVVGTSHPDSVPYMFLYRYGDGTMDHLAPSAPFGLRLE